jgi:hypothetical protein
VRPHCRDALGERERGRFHQQPREHRKTGITAVWWCPFPRTRRWRANSATTPEHQTAAIPERHANSQISFFHTPHPTSLRRKVVKDQPLVQANE